MDLRISHTSGGISLSTPSALERSGAQGWLWTGAANSITMPLMIMAQAAQTFDLAGSSGPALLFLTGVIAAALAAMGVRAQERSALKGAVAQARASIIVAAMGQGCVDMDVLDRLANLALDHRLRPPAWQIWHGKDGW